LYVYYSQNLKQREKTRKGIGNLTYGRLKFLILVFLQPVLPVEFDITH